MLTEKTKNTGKMFLILLDSVIRLSVLFVVTYIASDFDKMIQ